MRTKRREAFTMLSVLVVLFILLLTMSLMIPAIAKAREAAQRTTCANNLRQMGIALHAYHDVNKYFPSSGQILDEKGKTTAFTSQSTMTWILPYLEHKDIYDQFSDRRLPYNFKGKVKDDEVNNIKAAKNAIQEFLCQGNARRQKSGVDSKGFGYCDYMPIAFSNLTDSEKAGDLTTQKPGVVNQGIPLGSEDNFGNWPGALSCNYKKNISGRAADLIQKELLDKPLIVGDNFAIDEAKRENKAYCWADGSRGADQSEILDGLAHTMAIAEDSGLGEDDSSSSFDDPIEGKDNSGVTIPVRQIKGKKRSFRADWRWAEPAVAGGLSGPSNAKGKSNRIGAEGVRPINNFKTPIGGPEECRWKVENCGPNKEPFSFHQSGCNILFLDGHVTYMNEDVSFQIFRTLATPNEGVPVPTNDF